MRRLEEVGEGPGGRRSGWFGRGRRVGEGWREVGPEIRGWEGREEGWKRREESEGEVWKGSSEERV